MTLAQADAARLPYPSGHFHTIVCSPPYWGLRKYAGEQGRVWGGVEDCEHEWQENEWTRRSNDAKYVETSAKQLTNVGANNRDEPIPHATCAKCGAWSGSLGLEPTPGMHIEHMVEITREFGRVLRPDGVMWMNYGDCFATSPAGNKVPTGLNQTAGAGKAGVQAQHGDNAHHNTPGLPQGNLMLIPHRVALALQADGWILRQDLVWSKPNPMPESVNGWKWEKHRVKRGRSKHAADHNIKGGHKKMLEDASVHQGISPDWVPEYDDCPGCVTCAPNGGYVLRKGSFRHTRAHEYIFQFVRGMQYFCNQEEVRDGLARSTIERVEYGWSLDPQDPHWEPSKDTGRMGERYANPAGRNPRSVLDVPTQSYSGAHYATYPEALIAPLIRASTPRWCCPECGAPWAPVVEKQRLARHELPKDSPNYRPARYNGKYGDVHGETFGDDAGYSESNVLGYRPTCTHKHTQEQAVPGRVCDPFVGSGTTVKVAKDLLRQGFGSDISFEYLDEQAKVRAGAGTPSKALDNLPLFAELE